MKVLHLLNTSTFSGAENVVCQIIHMLKTEQNIRMVYCSRDGQIREALAERGILFAPIKDMSVMEIKRTIREVKPDIIHAHDMRASFIASLACGKIPLVSHIHNNAFDARRISMKSVAYILAGLKAKHIFWVSDSALNSYVFRRLFLKKSEVLHNIIDISALYEKMERDHESYGYDVSFLGRLSIEKDPLRLMRVVEKVIRKNPAVQVAIIGKGNLDGETRAMAEKLGLLKNVSFLGFQNNPLKIVYDSKVMIMTSKWEGTPMCALEAMALGVPIVSTPVDGLKRLITDGENGFLSDDDETLAEKALCLVCDAPLHDRFSRSAVASARELNNTAAYAEKLMRVYRKVLGDCAKQ